MTDYRIGSNTGRSEKIDFLITPTHARYLRLLAQGYTAREIAAVFGRSESTVMSAVKDMRRKLHAKNSAHLISIGYQKGILKVDV